MCILGNVSDMMLPVAIDCGSAACHGSSGYQSALNNVVPATLELDIVFVEDDATRVDVTDASGVADATA
jgi:hypothetical protein